MPDIIELNELMKSLAKLADDLHDTPGMAYWSSRLNDILDPTWIRAWLDD